MPIDPKTLDDAGLQNLIDNYRRQGVQDETYLAALAEHGKRKGKGLDFDTTVKVVRNAAAQSRYISYGEVAEASGAGWNQVRYAMGPHLDDLIEYCYLNSLPLLSSIVVNKNNVRTGELDPDSLKGFIAGVRRMKIPVVDDHRFLREEQQKVFAWARAHSSERT